MRKVVEGVKWLLAALWIVGLSVVIATTILFVGSATILHTIFSLLRRW